MTCYWLLSYIFGILAGFLCGTVAREAIANGHRAVSYSFGYQVAIWVDNHTTHCGGGIIDDHTILTAASCVIGENNALYGKPMYILAGTVDLLITGVAIQVGKIFVPTIYKPHSSTIENNIAVLKLKKSLEVDMNRKLQKLKIPTNARQLYTNKSVTIAGYGWDRFTKKADNTSDDFSDFYLRFTNAEVLDHAQCVQDHPTLRIGVKSLCARSNQHDRSRSITVCSGDDGGPLVYNSFVIGVLSHTEINCTRHIKSGIYSRVTKFLSFIENALYNYDTNFIRTIDL